MPTKAEIEQAKQEAADAKAAPKLEKLYNAASSTPAAPKAAASEPKKMASGGFTRAADGCAQRGKTRGKMV